MKLRIVIPVGIALMVFVSSTNLLADEGTPSPSSSSTTAASTIPSNVALLDIPKAMLDLYQGPAAHNECPGLKWSVLAAIGRVETNHDRSTAPGVHSGTNSAGAAGPMQFLKTSTWVTNAIDGNGDGLKDIYNPADAVPSAAHYLCSNGGGSPSTLNNAIFRYNHAQWYIHGGEGTPYPGVGKPDYCYVLCWAQRYDSARVAQGFNAGTLVWPVKQPGSSLTSCYGPRSRRGKSEFHPGLDISQASGTPVYTATSGIVTFAGPASGYGNNYVNVQSSSGSFITGYGHMNAKFVIVGQQVSAGEQIGIVGSQGESTGPHLHFNVIDLSLTHDMFNGNVNPLTSGLKTTLGEPNPNGCS